MYLERMLRETVPETGHQRTLAARNGVLRSTELGVQEAKRVVERAMEGVGIKREGEVWECSGTGVEAVGARKKGKMGRDRRAREG